MNPFRLKKNHTPPLEALRPPLFDVSSYWFSSLAAAFIIFFIMAFIGFKILYGQYFESYKETRSSENYENLIALDKLKSAVGQRSAFQDQDISLPKDPSLW